MRDEAARALAVPEVANGLHVGTYLPGSDADVYSRVAGNAWRRAGGRPTHQPVNGLGNHGGPFNAAVQNQPIIRFSNLYQEQGEPVRSYYKRVERAGILVKCSMDYKGARVLKRLKKEELAGYTHPVTPHEGAAEELTKNFQAQFKQLQASKPVRKPPVYRQQIKPVRPKPRPRVVQDHQDPDWDDDDQHVIDLIMGYETSKRFPKRLQKAKDRRDDLELARAMRNLDLNDDAMDIDTNTASFDDLKIVPDEEGGFRICAVRIKMTPIKIPVKVTSSKPTLIKAVTKNDSLSLLRSADFRKLLREILREELKSARKSTEIPEDLVEEKQEEDIREDDPMDIDIARLENTKDLLALDGKVNGIAIQCLADTCANASFIQREAAEELGLDIDKSITHNISGAPGSGRTFGMVKGVSIKLTPDCFSDVNRGDKK
ncbi:hypothetical protein GLOIN_2v1790588 [Rhizophagus irregularis DAOM 181602=DAOM 197198]|nr:hypothetical protein GLOIN_2v1790588 [Rhizophagus irregularis DAOM 181602=DAOM 197198]